MPRSAWHVARPARDAGTAKPSDELLAEKMTKPGSPGGITGCAATPARPEDESSLAPIARYHAASAAAATASFVGGTISGVLFTLFALPLAEVALAFGPPETFALMVLAFATFIGLGGDDISKTLFSIFIGLVFSAVGLDIISGEPRLIFGGLTGFYHGINFLVLAIGIYGIGEMLWTIEVSQGEAMMSKATVSFRRIINILKELRSSARTMVMGSFLGYFVGILPAAGATPGSLMAYGIAKTIAKNPETFGKGNVDGVVAPEAANNAASTGSMLPMLTLGIPGSPTTAILLGGMVIWGLEPGPLVCVDHPDFVWGLIASLYVANLFALLINIAFIPAFIWVLKMPFTILAPIIFVLCIIGGYVPTMSMHDVWLMLIFGIVGYLMRKLDYPMAPAVLAIVLGPLAEPALRQSLIGSQGEVMIFFERPISGTIMAIAIILFALPLIKIVRNRLKKPKLNA